MKVKMLNIRLSKLHRIKVRKQMQLLYIKFIYLYIFAHEKVIFAHEKVINLIVNSRNYF